MQALRAISWLLAVLSVILVVAAYDSLPAEIPVSRFSTAPKTLFLALRVPLINLASLALVELLATNVRRDARAGSKAERHLYRCLLGTVTAKVVVETTEILLLGRWQSAVTRYVLAAAVLVGLAAAAYFFSQLTPQRRKSIFNVGRTTIVLMTLLVAAIVALNVPLLGRLWSLES